MTTRESRKKAHAAGKKEGPDDEVPGLRVGRRSPAAQPSCDQRIAVITR
jgi:hypothetical protein